MNLKEEGTWLPSEPAQDEVFPRPGVFSSSPAKETEITLCIQYSFGEHMTLMMTYLLAMIRPTNGADRKE